MTFDKGDKLCSCTLLLKCGEGSYGEVWLAENAIGGKVALKILKKKFSEREIKGLQNYKDCDHPNLLKIRHIEISDDLVCYTMDAADDFNNGKGEYCPDTLANRLNRYGRLDGKEISKMLDGLLAALDELHKHGLVHRDIKPDNILYVNGRVTLSDAGLIAPAGLHTLVGSPGFISPRLMESGGVAETSDDFYALSKVIYCALTGLAPAEYPTIPPEMTISVDPKVNRAILAGCSQEIKSSAEFRKVIAGASVPEPPPENEPHEKAEGRAKTPLALKIILAGSILILAAAVFWMVRAGYRKSAGTTPPQESLEKSIAAATKLPDWKQEFLADREKRFAGLVLPRLSGQNISELLSWEFVSPKAMLAEVSRAIGSNIGNDELFRKLSLLYQALVGGKWEDAPLKSRQQYWLSQNYTLPELREKIFAGDPVMQTAAVNMVLTRYYHHGISRGFDLETVEMMQKLTELQNDFTDPDFGVVKYSSRKQEKTQEEFGNTVVPEYKFPDWKSEFETDRRERAKEYFNRFGLLTGSYFQELLTREMFDKKSIEPEIKRLKALHWADGTGRIWSDFETTLFYLQGTPDGAKVRERQQYWRSQQGTPREIASRMLFEDPVMQMVAVNMVLERLCRHVLTKQEFGGQNKEDIEKLIGLQEDFTDPVMGKIRYMGRKQAETYKK